MACAICGNRRPRRFCPGVQGEICTTCCGESREVTVSCPMDCPYLLEARKHDKTGIGSTDQLPGSDLRVTEEFLASHEAILACMAEALVRSALGTDGVVDFDVRDALDALVRTYRTIETGIYYETRPDNRLAAVVYDALQDAVTSYRKQETETLGVSRTRDSEVLKLLVFFQYFERDRNNGRKRGRAFLDALLDFYPDGPEEAPAAESPLILP